MQRTIENPLQKTEKTAKENPKAHPEVKALNTFTTIEKRYISSLFSTGISPLLPKLIFHRKTIILLHHQKMRKIACPSLCSIHQFQKTLKSQIQAQKIPHHQIHRRIIFRRFQTIHTAKK